MKKNRIAKIDYGILSSYLGRSATVIVFTAILLITIGALFLEQEDLAHMPVTIGVSAFDSVDACCTLESLADLVRERAGGDIKWRYFGAGTEPHGCDFYLMTSMQLSPYLEGKGLQCPLVATVAGGGRYSRGAVIVRADNESTRFTKVIFTSATSAAGFLSPYLALRDGGFLGDAGADCFEFAGTQLDEERVIFGVLFGAYDAGGIGQERFRYLERQGLVRRGELKVILTGKAFPEILLAAEPSMDSNKLKSFTRRFVAILDRASPSLRLELATLGIAGFSPARSEDTDCIKLLRSVIPHDLNGLLGHCLVREPRCDADPR